MITRSILMAAVLGMAAGAWADEPAPVADAVPTTVVSGYVDLSSMHLSGAGVFTSGVPDRLFDTKNGGIALQQAAVTVAYQPKDGFGGVVNLTAGNDANVIASYGAIGGGGNHFDVTQAYLQYATGSVTVMAGKFLTLAGAEVPTSPVNPNFSRSILFGYAIPFTHTGLRAAYTATDELTLNLGVNNGWDSLRTSNTGKTLELGATYAASKTLSLVAAGYFGRERVMGLVNTGPDGNRTLLDVVATWTVTEALTLVLNADWATQLGVTDGIAPPVSAHWSGVAGYANYTFGEHWKGSFRAEVMSDQEGYRTGVPQHWKEATATLAYLPVKAVELRLEARADRSNVQSFVIDPQTHEVSSSQNSLALQALFKF
jgi:hypothetical protein